MNGGSQTQQILNMLIGIRQERSAIWINFSNNLL